MGRQTLLGKFVGRKLFYMRGLMIRSIGSGELEHSTHPLPFSAWGIKPPTKFSKSGEGSYFLEDIAGKEGVTLFRGVVVFT